MPRVGLNTEDVVSAGAELADEKGIGSVTFTELALRLGVKPPALYRHVASVGDLQSRIATLALNELGQCLRFALQGKSGKDAIRALFQEMQRYIAEHPGRYSAVNGARLDDDSGALLAATKRVFDSIRAVLSGYDIKPEDVDHAIRTLRSLIHGYALLQVDDSFHWSTSPAGTLEWMVIFVDTGLIAMGRNGRK